MIQTGAARSKFGENRGMAGTGHDELKESFLSKYYQAS
jgi:hypothetical protein